MKKIKLILILSFITFVSYAQDITKGTWYNSEKTATVKFYTQGGKLYGKIVKLKEPTKDGKPRVDEFNPDKSKRNTPLVGMVFLKNFKQANAKDWEEGEIYDPKTGKTYSSEMKLENENILKVRGYIGISLIGKTTVFTRATND